MFIKPSISNLLLKKNWLADCLALAGVLVFGLQLWFYAHTQISFVDEGTYLYLGHRFVAVGDISYGDLGSWSYYAPLSYLVPGFIELLFGPGLRPGRYFSVFCAILMIIALWFLARRFGGKWWAVAIVWALALSPMQIKMYSLALSQSLTACLLIWTLVLVMGEKRSTGQIMAGSVLAGITVMTRHNLILLLPMLAGYICWQHGRKMGIWSMLGCALPVILGMALYWPNSLRLWALFWLPEQWIPALSKFGPPRGSDPVWEMQVSHNAQFSAFFMGLRAHYLALTGAFASLLLWPKQWINSFKRKAGTFLVALFFSLFVLHAWVSLGYSQCTYCFAPYIAFFSNLALLLVVVTFSSWVKKLSITRQVVIVLFLLFISLTPAFIDHAGDYLLALPVPRISDGIRVGEWATLWNYLSSLFKVEYSVARIALPPFFYLASGILLLVLIFCAYRLILRWNRHFQYSFGTLALIVFLLGGFVFSPLMNGDYRQNGECAQDVISNYEKIGAELASIISEGSRVYWNVGSAVPLLYLPPIEIHPALVYGAYTYRIGGDAEEVEASGYWNEELAKRWMIEADFLVMEESLPAYTPPLEEVVDLDSYTLTVLSPVNPCRLQTQLLVYQRIP